jgi:hypothetical protein
MDGIQPGGLPATEPAAGKMSLREAVRAGVNSIPKFNGGQAPSPASDDLAAEEPSISEAPAKATPDAGSSASDLPDAGEPGESTPRPVEGHTDEQASKEPLAAPARWPEDRRKAFEALPEDAKRILLEREKEFNTGLTQHAQKSADSVKKLEAINSHFQDHHRKEMQAAGLDEAGAIRDLLARHDAFNRDPVGYGAAVAKQLGKGDPALYIAELIKRTGVTQQQLFGGQAPQGQQPQADPASQVDEWEDPAIVEMKRELGELKQFFQQQKDRERQTVEQQQKEAERQFYEQVQAFENAVNDDGTPKYPHIGSVVNEVIRLVANDPELYRNPHKALETAYGQAIYANPSVRQQLLEEEFSKRLAAKEAQAAADRAKRAAPAKPTPGSAGGTVARGPMTIREAARAAVTKHVPR